MRTEFSDFGASAKITNFSCRTEPIHMYSLSLYRVEDSVQGSKLRYRTKLPRWPQTTKSKSPD